MNARTMRLAVLAASQLALAGCVAPPTGSAPAMAAAASPSLAGGAVVTPVALPSGIDMRRMRALDAGETLKVYVNLVGIGNRRSDERVNLLFPETRTRTVGTSAQLDRRFVDMVRATNRFEVYTDEANGLRSESEVVVDGMVVFAGQRWQTLLAQQKAVTTVRMSVEIKDRATHEIIPPNIDTITGVYGTEPGEGTVLAPGRVTETTIDSLTSDFESALEDALQTAAVILQQRMRPLGRVTSVDGQAVALFGGERHGLQPGDVMVVFRPSFTTLGKRRVMTTVIPVARLRCDSVQVDVSQCLMQTIAPGAAPQKGDYAVVADESLKARLTR